MISHFIDLKVRPDPEFSQTHLVSALYSKLHRQLVSMRSDNIAVGFPGYSLRPRGLGDTVRLLGAKDPLEALMESDWVMGMESMVNIASISTVPPGAAHRCLKRRQFKTSGERLRRRFKRRHDVTDEEVERLMPDRQVLVDLPYVRLRSTSTGQAFSMFLALSDPLTQPVPGSFNSYGLSAQASIPWF